MNAGTLLLRQVHPSFVQRDRITSQVFAPRPSNQNHLSVYDGDQISAEASWQHYTGELRLKSAGVVGVAVSECTSEGIQARADPSDFPEHALIEFGEMGKGCARAVAKRLRVAAEERGWLYREEHVLQEACS